MDICHAVIKNVLGF